MKHCQNCGAENESMARFCRACGTKLEDEVQREEPVPLSITPPAASSAPAAAPKKKTSSLFIGASAAVVLIVAVIALFSGRKSTAPAAAKPAIPVQQEGQSMEPVRAQPPQTPAAEPEDSLLAAEAQPPVLQQAAQPTPESVFISANAYENMVNSCNANNSGLFCARDGIIYFRSGVFMESSNSSYGLKSLASGKETLLYEGPNWYTMAGENELYFYDHRDSRRAKALDLTTGETRYLSDFQVDYMVLLDGMLYISRDGGGIYRIDPKDAGSAVRITDKPAYSLSIKDGLLYYVSSTDSRLYCFANSQAKLVQEIGKVRSAVVLEQGILYQTNGNRGALCLYEPDGKEHTLAADGVEAFVTDGERVYFTHADTPGILTVDLVGDQTFEWIDVHEALNLCLVEDWIYYVNTDRDTPAKNDQYQLWRVKTDGSQSEEIF